MVCRDDRGQLVWDDIKTKGKIMYLDNETIGLPKEYPGFKELNSDEIKAYKKWARENYEPFSKISEIWHPVIQNECLQINKANASKN